MSSQRDLDQRTDRLARRLVGHRVPRDAYLWAQLRMDIALTDSRRVVEFQLTPAVGRLGRALSDAGEAFERFAEAFRRSEGR